MPKFCKLPLEVEAFLFEGDKYWPGWFTRAIAVGDVIVGPGAARRDYIPSEPPSGVVGARIKTLEGDILANLGDWIIRGVEGEIYPCKPGIFHKIYVLAERDATT